MRKLFLLALTLIMISVMALTASAAELSVTYGDDIKAGDTFEFTVKYEDQSLDSVKGMVEYDDQMLKYVSGGSSEGNGGIVAIDSHSEDGKVIEETIIFEALREGQTNLMVTTEECYDLNGGMLNSPWAEYKVIVAAVDPVEKKKKEEAEKKKKEEAAKKKAEEERQKQLEAEAQALAEREALIKAQEEQKANNDKLVKVLTGITAFLLVLAIILRAIRKKKK